MQKMLISACWKMRSGPQLQSWAYPRTERSLFRPLPWLPATDTGTQMARESLFVHMHGASARSTILRTATFGS